MTQGQPYSASNYVGQVLPSRRSASHVLPGVVAMLGVKSAVDIGCGAGAWLAELGTLGVDAVGVEGGHPSDDELQVPREQIQAADLREPVDLGRRFDLVLSLEVAEHIDSHATDIYLDTLSRHGDALLFSAAIPSQGGYLHVNEQWPDYWNDRLAQRGFVCFDPWRDALWGKDDHVEWWYQQNLLLFARADARKRVEAAGVVAGPPRRLVHPELFERTAQEAYRTRGLRESAATVGQRLKQRLK